MIIQKRFIEMVETTPFDVLDEVKTLGTLAEFPDKVHLFPKYHKVGGEIRLRPSLTLTLSNNQTRVLYFDSPEDCERWQKLYTILPPNAVISHPMPPKGLLGTIEHIISRLTLIY